MDRWRAQVLVYAAMVQRARLRERIVYLEKRIMTPKVQGVASALAKLQHNLDARAGKFLDRIEGLDKKSDETFKKAHSRLDEAEQPLADIDKVIDALAEQTNGGPSLDGSAESSDEPAKEPQASWGNQQPK
jgi:hypothetical protein